MTAGPLEAIAFVGAVAAVIGLVGLARHDRAWVDGASWVLFVVGAVLLIVNAAPLL